MAHAKISAADMKGIRAQAARLQKKGLSPSAALAKAIDKEIAESETALASVRDQARPKSSRNIDFSLRHENHN